MTFGQVHRFWDFTQELCAFESALENVEEEMQFSFYIATDPLPPRPGVDTYHSVDCGVDTAVVSTPVSTPRARC